VASFKFKKKLKFWNQGPFWYVEKIMARHDQTFRRCKYIKLVIIIQIIISQGQLSKKIMIQVGLSIIGLLE